MNSELDRMFEHSMSNLSRAPQAPLTDEQIATAAKASKTGAVLWLRMHMKEILTFAILLAVGIGGTLLVTHYTGNQRVAPEPAEPVAAVMADTTLVSDDAAARPAEPTMSTVETRHGTSLQNDQPANSSAKPNIEPAAPPVVVKKTIVQRDTVVINETVIIKDTTYVP
jgi:cytoskeletal protein RodZ